VISDLVFHSFRWAKSHWIKLRWHIFAKWMLCIYSNVYESTGYLAPAIKYVRSSSLLLFWTVSGDETRQRVKFTDERVCKSHLLNCCPHDILSGTVSGPLKMVSISVLWCCLNAIKTQHIWFWRIYHHYNTEKKQKYLLLVTSTCAKKLISVFMIAYGPGGVYKDPWPGTSGRLWNCFQGERSFLWAWCEWYPSIDIVFAGCRLVS